MANKTKGGAATSSRVAAKRQQNGQHAPAVELEPARYRDETGTFGSYRYSPAEELFTETRVRAVSARGEYALSRDEIIIEIGSLATGPTADQRGRSLRLDLWRHQGRTVTANIEDIDAYDILRLHTALGRVIRDAQKIGFLPVVEEG